MGDRLSNEEIDHLRNIADTHGGGIKISRERALKLFDEVKDIRASGMTIDTARVICGIGMLLSPDRMGDSIRLIAQMLLARFPAFKWRVYLDHSGCHTKWGITVDEYEPREHYVARGRCVLCGKTAAELPLNKDRTDEYESRD